MRTLEQKLNEISPGRQKKIKARTRELIARNVSTRTQACGQQNAKDRGPHAEYGQDGVSRLEKLRRLRGV